MEEENKVRKFRLIDKQGYLDEDKENKSLVDYFGDIFSGYEDDNGFIINDKTPSPLVIDRVEFQFFEEITDEQETSVPKETPSPDEALYWQEGQPLTAGLIVGKKCSGENEYFVKYVGDFHVVLSDKREETTSTISNLRSLVKSDKDVIFDKVLSVWKSRSLDNSYDNKSSIVHLGSFFDVMYQVMKGES